MKLFDLMKDIVPRVVGLRFLLIMLFLGALFVFRFEVSSAVKVLSYIVIIASALIYLWAGWRITKSGSSLPDACKIGIGTGIFVGLMTAVFSGVSALPDIAFNILIETVFALIFTVIGAFIATKVKII